MFFHHLRTSFRSLWKSRLYTTLNISGLALGMTTTIFILIYAVHQLTFDRFHANYRRIFQLVDYMKFYDQEFRVDEVGKAFGPTLKEKLPQVSNYLRILREYQCIIQSDNNHKFFEDRLIFADSSFFSLFSFDLIRGNYRLLGNPGTVVLTEESARKYFGDEDPIGKTITYNNLYPLQIIGIAKKAPSNSSIQFDFVASLPTLATIPEEAKVYHDDHYWGGSFLTFILITDPVKIPDIAAFLKVLAYQGQEVNKNRIELEPISQLHLNGAGASTLNTTKLFIAIAFLIFALAILNYINMTTSRAVTRIREVSIRKIIGARKSILLMQFFVESAAVVMASFGIAILLVWFLTPWFVSMLQQRFDVSFLYSHAAIICMSLTVIACILISSAYPAFMMAAFKPLDIVQSKSTLRSSQFRRALTTLQFGTTIVLIICSLVINKQLTFMRNKNIGLNKDQVLVIHLQQNMTRYWRSLKSDISQLSGVSSVGYATQSLFDGKGTDRISFSEDGQSSKTTNLFDVDEDFFNTLGIAWREKGSSIENNYVVNQEALNEFGIKGDPIDAKMVIDDTTMRVKGVVKDFNFTSLHDPIGPLTMRVFGNGSAHWLNQYLKEGNLYIRLKADTRLPDNMAEIKQIYARYDHESPLSYYFLDDAYNNLYTSEDRMMKLFQSFTIISIIIASLGLFGLVTYTAERKTKEIGIRKVLGASVRNIMVLLSKEYGWLLLIGAVIGVPIAWMAMNRWLDSFPYRITIPYDYAGIAAALALIIAVITISYQVIRAAFTNPVNSLRSE